MRARKGVLKGWVSLGTCMLKRVCEKGGTKEHMHTQHEGMHLHPRYTIAPHERNKEFYDMGKG